MVNPIIVWGILLKRIFSINHHALEGEMGVPLIILVMLILRSHIESSLHNSCKSQHWSELDILTNHMRTQWLGYLEIDLQPSLSAPVQGVHLWKEAVVFRGPLILVMPISGLHIDLDQLKGEASTPQHMPVATSGHLSLLSSSFWDECGGREALSVGWVVIVDGVQVLSGGTVG